MQSSSIGSVVTFDLDSNYTRIAHHHKIDFIVSFTPVEHTKIASIGAIDSVSTHCRTFYF